MVADRRTSAAEIADYLSEVLNSRPDLRFSRAARGSSQSVPILLVANTVELEPKWDS